MKLAWLLLAACHAPVAAPDPHVAVRSAFETACGDCHPGEGRPPVDELLGKLATRSLQRIAAGQMPPPYGLPFPQRDALIRGLCATPQCYDTYTLGELPHLLRAPQELTGDILSHWHFSDDTAQTLDGVGTSTGAPAYESPSVDGFLLVTAINGCTEANKADPKVSIEECVRSIMARSFIRASEPAP
jgi:hypothetical protein